MTRKEILVKKDLLKMGRNKTVIKDRWFDYVILKAFRAFKVPPVKPIHLNDIFDYDLDIRKSSPGIPWQSTFKTRGEVMDDMSARNSIRLFWHHVKDGEKKDPPKCKVYCVRIQRDEPKIRAVYEYPTTITLMEACFAIPLINAYKEHSTPIAYEYDMAVDGACKLRRKLLCLGERKFGCFVFKNFDKTITEQLIEIAFVILLMSVDLTGYHQEGVPRVDKLARAWDYLVEYFIRTPLILSNGEYWKKRAGIPSGSYFTQLIGSIINWILINYAFIKLYGKLPEDCLVFGDDSVIATTFPFSIYQLAEFLNRFGMELDPLKSIVTSNVDEVFLMR